MSISSPFLLRFKERESERAQHKDDEINKGLCKGMFANVRAILMDATHDALSQKGARAPE